SETENYTSASNTSTFVIEKAPVSIKLFLNGNEWTSNKTVTYPFDVNINGTINVSELQSNVKLYRNEQIVNNPFTGRLAVDNYTFKAEFSGNENYSSAISEEFVLTIQKNISKTFLSFDKSSPQVYGTSIIAYCSGTNPEASAKLYRNGIDVTSEIGKAVVLGAGTYNYVCNVSETENYTSASNTSTFVIEKNKFDLDLMLNGIKSNITVNEGTIVNITAIIKNVNITSDIELYINDSFIKREKSLLYYSFNTIGLSGIHKIIANVSGNENFTEDQKIYYITVLQDTT
ncbi:MAG: hypothetical protein N3D20_03345, partial [Candidatus Pacearchaeota archaeon]|nr:hypothetical protein [Candidatus Pacearchaeota archaeon]